MQDYVQAAAWGEGRDPCAPWTRLWPGRGLSTNPLHHARATHPNQQFYARVGDAFIGVILSLPRHRQEPPEEQREGTPRVCFRARENASEALAALARPPVSLAPEDRMPLHALREGRRLFLRDPGGNFVEVECAGD